MTTLGSTTAGAIRKALENDTDDTIITFEFLTASFFKDAYQNMQQLLKDAYTQGYMQAKEEYNGN